MDKSWNSTEDLISFESIDEESLDAISNEGYDFISEWLDEEWKWSRE